MHFTHVIPNTGRAVKGLSTGGALVGHLTSVSPPVVRQLGAHFVGLAADVADVVTHVLMYDLNVSPQLGREGVVLPTDVAGVGATVGAGVHPLSVTGEAGEGVEDHAALGAREGLFSGVDDVHVDLEGGGG